MLAAVQRLTIEPDHNCSGREEILQLWYSDIFAVKLSRRPIKVNITPFDTVWREKTENT